MKSLKSFTDKELVRMYLDGNHLALEQLISKHESRVFSYILMVVKDKELADDIFQDTFIKVIKTLRSGSYQEKGKFLQWVMRISHNLIIDFYRKEKRIPKLDNNFFDDFDVFDMLERDEPSVEEAMIINQIHEDVRNLVDFLPDEQKEVLIMRHYSGMSFKDIAEQTGVSINTALGRMRYALINLRKLVEEKGLVLTM